MKTVIALALFLCSSACYAEPPDWFDPNNLHFTFQGSMGGGDIDRVVPSAHEELGGLVPGTEWYARVDQPSPGVVLSSWEGYTPANDSFAGLLASNAGSTSEELSGVVRPDGGIYLCVSQTGNEQCVFGGAGFGNANDYTFSLAVREVPEPSIVAFSSLMLAFFLASSRIRKHPAGV